MSALTKIHTIRYISNKCETHRTENYRKIAMSPDTLYVVYSISKETQSENEY